MSNVPPSGSAPVPGSIIGRYRIVETLGAGGSATVYRACHVDMGRTVALKILHPLHVLPDDRQRFAREYDTVRTMHHPNVVKVYDAGMHDGFPWIAMECVDGRPLDALIEAWSATPPPDRFERIDAVLRGLCAGLQYVHDLGFVHRDVKPSNVLVRPDGAPLLTDFGVVKSRNASTQLTQMGQLVGTVAFMAPEQIAERRVDARADLYALGAVLYMMLTGRRPIEADSVGAYLTRHLSEIPPAPIEVDPTVPRSMSRVCQRLLLKDPAQRYASAAAVVAALDDDEVDELPPLRGREAQLTWLSRRLDALKAGHAGVVLVTGAPGSGRSQLLDATLDLAGGKGVRTRRSAASEGVDHLPDPGDARPTLVVLDDLDAGGAALVAELTGALNDLVGVPLLLLASTDLDSSLVAPLKSGAVPNPAEVLELGPLDRRAVIAMLRDRGLTGAAVSVLGRRLHAEFRGLPGPILGQVTALINAGWLVDSDGVLTAARPSEHFASEPLPVPALERARLSAALDAIGPDALDVAELIAMVGQSCPLTFLSQCVPDVDVERAAYSLVRARLAVRVAKGSQERLAAAHPAVATLLCQRMDEPRRKTVHLRIARALNARRRRDPSPEAARHFIAGGEPEQALEILLKGARRAARTGQFDDVLRLCRKAAAIREAAVARMPTDQATKLVRWLHMLTGEAQLARQQWEPAAAALTAAVDAARAASDDVALTRCLSSLGRALYRKGAFTEGAPVLEEALERAAASAPERSAAARALADIRLRSGDLAAAGVLWQEALDAAIELGSRDAEARARRGMAHLRALQQRFLDAADLLDQAEDLLEIGGDARVRASVVARSIELDLAAGRYGTALHRCDQLLELAREPGSAARLPEANALYAAVMTRLGLEREAMRAALKVAAFAAAAPTTYWDPLVRAARVLAHFGRPADAARTLAPLGELELGPDDPAGQLAALRARTGAVAAPRDVAVWALSRQPPVLALAGAAIALDASAAFAQVGAREEARRAAKHGLKQLPTDGTDGVRLELLLALHRAAPDDRVLYAAGQLAMHLVARFPAATATAFRSRPDVHQALIRATT